MAALTALAAPSAVSYQRLKPHHWSASWTTLGERDREATLRICPTSERPGHDPSRAFNMEFRAADATASPHLALAMLIRAGIEGVKAGLETPPIIKGDPDEMSADDRARLGIRRLPSSLPEALAALEADKVVCGWLPPTFLDCWKGMRLKELEIVSGLDDAALCSRYAEIY
jgi:glutamine synthetase